MVFIVRVVVSAAVVLLWLVILFFLAEDLDSRSGERSPPDVIGVLRHFLIPVAGAVMAAVGAIVANPARTIPRIVLVVAGMGLLLLDILGGVTGWGFAYLLAWPLVPLLDLVLAVLSVTVAVRSRKWGVG